MKRRNESSNPASNGDGMKPSKLKKDAQVCVRINSEIKETLRKKGKSAQKIVDQFIDKNFHIDKELNLKG